MIESRLQDRSCQPSPASSLYSVLQGTREEVGDYIQELGFLKAHPPTEGDPLRHNRSTTFSVCPAVNPIPSPVPGSPTHPPPAALAQTTASPSAMPSPSTTASAPGGDTMVGKPIPPSWQPPFVEGKIKVSSPDSFTLRSSVCGLTS
ncbi:hypothetical protein Pcinc_015088 [Petrolisthes cinctipes]|uniref:Uncharacterized protein n=1 Tax=Petrolisthes cinctipes TaxID=88211 RepID=A0AAE1KSK1_PETCI|nr:hypothetical protein Pcinc_015088 [Petrolisthes cinctipes]